MRFLVDECTGSKVANWLRQQNHEVFSVFDELRGMTDDEILSKASKENRILITNDKDFGEMIFREQRQHYGIIFMWLDDERSSNKITVLENLLENYADKIKDNFVAVTETKVRIVEN